ncbi:MAG: potassium channel family protein [Nanoarchaeota archaeon]
MFVLLTIGTFMFKRLEGWSYMSSFYFSVVTLTTVGYGDIHPTTDISRLFTAIYILVGVTIAVASISVIAKNYVEVKEKEIRNKVMGLLHSSAMRKNKKK